MSDLPAIENYGDYSSENYGVHSLRVVLPTITLYYSYKTIVAFYTHETGRVCSENIWSSTTGKHLNKIEPNKPLRWGNEVFNKMLQDALQTHIV